jgi:serine phosphatase RsbU (regulator of sigma subunit)
MVPAKGQAKVDSLQDLLSNSDSDSVSIIILDQIGAYYVEEGDYLEAAVWLDKQLSGGYKMSDDKKMTILISLGLCYQNAQIIDKALDYFYLSRDFAIEINNKDYEALVYSNIASTYELFDIYDKSLEYHFKALEIRKTINSSLIKVSLDGIGLIYRNYRIKLNANRALSDINDILDEKNHDIMSNITYAKKIQDALLPADKNMKETLHDSFNLYYPKDLVSGDFYWIHSDKNDIYFAAVDCTGHGVSGAFMSIIGLTLLDEVIVKQGIKELDKVLNTMREYIITSLHQTGEAGETRDGMDIAICKLSGNKIEFAGAHNPLIIIRNNELIEIKGDAQPIGFYTGEKAPFTKHEYLLEKGDMIYVFSDGFQDQFGGPKGKKYMAGKFKKLLLRINEQSSADQYQSLADEFQSWKGDHEQVDDVCVIGVRV